MAPKCFVTNFTLLDIFTKLKEAMQKNEVVEKVSWSDGIYGGKWTGDE